MIWVAVFILCTSQTCFSVGSPVFKSQEDCEMVAAIQGVAIVSAQHPDAKILTYKCVSFGKVEA